MSAPLALRGAESADISDKCLGPRLPSTRILRDKESITQCQDVLTGVIMNVQVPGIY